jgi:hypothetical protein
LADSISSGNARAARRVALILDPVALRIKDASD